MSFAVTIVVVSFDLQLPDVSADLFNRSLNLNFVVEPFRIRIPTTSGATLELTTHAHDLLYNAGTEASMCMDNFHHFQEAARAGSRILCSSFIHSFIPFLQRLFKSTTTQKRSRHSTDTVPEFDAEAPQATVS